MNVAFVEWKEHNVLFNFELFWEKKIILWLKINKALVNSTDKAVSDNSGKVHTSILIIQSEQEETWHYSNNLTSWVIDQTIFSDTAG